MNLTPGIREKRLLLLERLAKKQRQPRPSDYHDGNTSSLTSSDFSSFGEREKDDSSRDPNRVYRPAFHGPLLEELPCPRSFPYKNKRRIGLYVSRSKGL